MAFEDRVKQARKNAGLTQERAAASIGVAKSTWAGYESGSSQPDIAKIVKIMDVLKVDANYLWQDYATEKAPAMQRGAVGNGISLEESNSLLVRLGFIKEGEQLSDEDLAFLASVIGLLDAWFSRKQA